MPGMGRDGLYQKSTGPIPENSEPRDHGYGFSAFGLSEEWMGPDRTPGVCHRLQSP